MKYLKRPLLLLATFLLIGVGFWRFGLIKTFRQPNILITKHQTVAICNLDLLIELVFINGINFMERLIKLAENNNGICGDWSSNFTSGDNINTTVFPFDLPNKNFYGVVFKGPRFMVDYIVNTENGAIFEPGPYGDDLLGYLTDQKN